MRPQSSKDLRQLIDELADLVIADRASLVCALVFFLPSFLDILMYVDGDVILIVSLTTYYM